jgi:hypothetical protein
LSVLLKLWSDWNPLGLPETEGIHYEPLAIMTLQTMKCHPSHEELVASLKYFIGIESSQPLQPTEQHLLAFAERILNDDVLAAAFRSRWTPK